MVFWSSLFVASSSRSSSTTRGTSAGAMLPPPTDLRLRLFDEADQQQVFALTRTPA